MTSPQVRGWCGTMEVHRRLLTTDPAYALARNDIEGFAFEFCRQPSRRDQPVTIPVVVHVVWHTEQDNIDDTQIRGQIDVLNADFRARNADVASVPAVWRSRVGDAMVQFALAGKDPSGAASTGITRTKTSVAEFGTDDAVKFTARGGADAWPSDRYLNVWVCRLTGGLLGYAQFPGGAAGTDGVVLRHAAVGTTGTATAPFNGGRTATHEVGHWLNLRHIWGDDGDGCSGSDFVDDTPNQGGPNYGSPTFPKVSCKNGPDGDMFVNYMDYTDDKAMFMFTKGQVTRMDACLRGPRASLLPATAASTTTTAVHTVGTAGPDTAITT